MPSGRVRDFMTRNPLTVRESDPLRQAVELVMVRRIRHIPVLSDDGRLVGIVTDRDIKRTLPSPLSSTAPEEHEAILETTPIGRVMTREPSTVEADSELSVAVALLIDRKIGGLPVLEAGKLVGVFTQRDALRGYLKLLRG